MTDKDRAKEILKEINKDLKTNMTFGDDPNKILQRISTGEPGIDSITGGGIPRRGITILFGPPSSGKTYLCQRIMAAGQRNGSIAALVDAEYSFDPEWYEKSGVDVSTLIHVEPSSAEEALEWTISLCKKGVDIVVVDSTAALLPEEEDEKNMDDFQMGLHARLMNKFFRKVAPHNKRTAIILINQIRLGIGQGSGKYVPEVLPGGKGQEFYAKIIMSIRKGDLMWNDGEGPKTVNALPIGFDIKVTANKNKTAQPLRQCIIPFYFSGETDSLMQLFQVGIYYGVIDQAGPYYSYKDEKEQGRAKFMTMLEEKPYVKTAMIEAINEAVKND